MTRRRNGEKKMQRQFRMTAFVSVLFVSSERDVDDRLRCLLREEKLVEYVLFM